jgi:hypothetical protein
MNLQVIEALRLNGEQPLKMAWTGTVEPLANDG